MRLVNIFFMETKMELNYRHLIIYTCEYLKSIGFLEETQRRINFI